MGYEELLIEADNEGLLVKEKPLPISDGRIKGNKIAIREDLPTFKKKADVLAEELGHYYTTVGRIIDQDTVEQQKQERGARLWSYNKRIGLIGLVNAFKACCSDVYEIAEYLNVSEEFLKEALACYRSIYGESGEIVDNYLIKFEPYLQVYEFFTI